MQFKKRDLIIKLNNLLSEINVSKRVPTSYNKTQLSILILYVWLESIVIRHNYDSSKKTWKSWNEIVIPPLKTYSPISHDIITIIAEYTGDCKEKSYEPDIADSDIHHIEIVLSFPPGTCCLECYINDCECDVMVVQTILS